MKGENRQIIEGVIWKELLIFFFPILLGTFFQQLYNTVDAIIVGRALGKAALAAVGGATGYLVNFLVNFFVGLSSGATVVIAQYFGAGDPESTEQAVHTSMFLSLAAGVVMSLLGIVAAPWALRVLNSPPEVLPLASDYLQIFYGGMIFMFIYNMGASVLRARGDSKRPFYLLVLCTVVNIFGDLLFVVRLKMGVAGAAYATVISQMVSAAGVCLFLMREKGPFRLSFKRLWKWNRPIMGNIIRIGLPTGLQSDMFSLSNLVIQTTINGFGVNLAAAWATYGKIDHLYWMILSALGVAVSTFSGQNFGARKYSRVYKSIHVTAWLALGFSLFFGFVYVYWGRLLYSIFTNDEYVISLGMKIMWLMPPWYFTYVPVDALAGGMRGTGDSVMPTVITALGVCVFRVCWIWFVVPFRHTTTVVFLSYPVSWILTSVLFLIYNRWGHWMERSVIRAGHRSKKKEPQS
jgi:putative MATE family efflux protein